MGEADNIFIRGQMRILWQVLIQILAERPLSQLSLTIRRLWRSRALFKEDINRSNAGRTCCMKTYKECWQSAS